MPWQFSGILLYAEGDRVMAELMGAGTMAGIAYRPNSGVWDSPLIEASSLAPESVRCQHDTCPIRARASRVAHIGSVSSGDVLLAESGIACSCWGLRQDLLLLITAFLSFLIADGVVSEEITVLPTPQSHSQRRHHSGTGIPRNPIRYQRLSLTHPQSIVVRRLPNGQAEVTPQGVMEGTLSREITRRPHPRLLIAGPGQRWTKTQIVFVHASKPFYRRVSGNPIRFIVDA